jgi:ribosomal protein L13E
MPLEITVDTKRKKGNETLYLEKMDELQKRLKKYLNFQNRSPFLI